MTQLSRLPGTEVAPQEEGPLWPGEGPSWPGGPEGPSWPGGPQGPPLAEGATPRRRLLRTIFVVLLLMAAVAVVRLLFVSSTPAVATKIDPALVDVTSILGYQEAESLGTGMVLTPGGEVLTNNHVVDGATSVSVTDVGNGRTYSATVVGTDAAADVAVLQLSGASGLPTVPLGTASTVRVGDAVVGIGNAGGLGGTPATASGTVTALDQSITAVSPEGTEEQLSNLIETNAPIVAGDSGGPLVDNSKVVGIDTAASNGYSLQVGTTSQAFAIPIDTALSVARQIEAGLASSTIHIGASAFLGVEVRDAGSGSGALVVGLFEGSPADKAGIAPGDVIDSFGGQTITSASDLSSAMRSYHPGDTVTVQWVGPDGQTHSSSITLTTGPAD